MSNEASSTAAATRMSPAELFEANQPSGTQGLLAVDKVGMALLWFDPVTHEQTGRLPLVNPHQLALAPDHTLAYLGEYGVIKGGRNIEPGRAISIVDVRARQLIGRIELGEDAGPHGLRWAADGRLWVICEESGALIRIDAARRQCTDRVQVALPKERAHLIEITPDGKRIFVSCKFGSLKVVDVDMLQVISTVELGPGTEGIAVTPQGDRLIVAENAEQSLIVIDPRSLRTLDRVALKGSVLSSPKRSRLITLQMAPQTGQLLSSNGVSGVVHIHSLANLHDQHLIIVAKGPQGMAVTADGSAALVANHDAGIATSIALTGPQAGSATGWFEAGTGVEALTFYGR